MRRCNISQYRIGKVTVVTGSAVVIGENTEFIDNIEVGYNFNILGENVIYTIQSIDTDLQITLTSNYTGNSDNNLNYIVGRDFTQNLNLPEIWPGDKDWAYHLTTGLRIIDNALTQTLLTTSSPIFKTIKLTDLTNGYVPYHVNDATGLANSPIFTDGINIGIGSTTPNDKLVVTSTTNNYGLTVEGSGDIGATFRMMTGGTNSGARNWGFVIPTIVNGDFAIRQSDAKGGDPITAGTTRFYIKNDGNVGIGTTSFGTSTVKILALGEGTAPTTSPADIVQLWSANEGGRAGYNQIHMRNEAGQSGAIAFQAPLQNILDNTQWKIWSNGTLENVGTQISVTGITAGVCATANTQGLAIGKLVKFGAGGSTANTTYEVTALTANVSFTINNTSITAATAVTCYEVTPGCVGADAKGPEGWWKEGGNIRLWRECEGPNTQLGALYSLKAITTAINQRIAWSYNSYGVRDFRKTFAGRTVTFGCWVKTSTPSSVTMRFYDDVSGYTSSAQHTGGGSWEWLEVSHAFSSSIADIGFYIYNAVSGTTVYLSQPMLVFGSSIGQGNYQSAPNETINFESPITLSSWNGTTAGADGVVNVEVESAGKIGKGVKAFNLNLLAKDSAVADGVGLKAQTSSTNTSGFSVRPQVNNLTNAATGRIGADANGDFYADVTAGGTLTSTINVIGVTLN